MKALQLLPIGNRDGRLLEEILPALEATFGAPCRVSSLSLEPEFAFHRERQQYHSSEILQGMQSFLAPDSWRLLGIASVDVYIPILTYVFGEAQMGGPCAMLSTHRLRQEFYGLPADHEVLVQRTIKEAIHELGHTLHLTHCHDHRCAMASSHSVERIDLKESALCHNCRRIALRANAGFADLQPPVRC
jgi:archaemetzincin